FANQPGVEGMTDEQIEAFATEAGASEQAVSDIQAGTYDRWVDEVADPHGEETGGGTPYIEIDGTVFEPWNQPGALKEAVLAAGGETASDGGGASDGGQG